MNKVCPNCGRTHNIFAHGMCRKCWRALPENKAKENAYSQKWYANHREDEVATNKEYRKQNRELFDWYHNKDRFNGVRELVLSRDSHKCQCCGGSDKLVIHHLDSTNYRKGNANNGLENLIVLCPSCHSFLHHHQRRNNTKLTREDIVQSLVKAKEVFRNEYPLLRREQDRKRRSLKKS